MIAELVEMRDAAASGSVSRRLAERCLEICFQEIAANDAIFPPPPLSVVDDLIRTISGARDGRRGSPVRPA